MMVCFITLFLGTCSDVLSSVYATDRTPYTLLWRSKGRNYVLSMFLVFVEGAVFFSFTV